MDLAYPESLWLLVVGARPPASQPRASSPAPRSCPVCVWNVLSRDFGVGSFWLLLSILTRELSPHFAFLRPFTPSLPVLWPSAPHPEKKKESCVTRGNVHCRQNHPTPIPALFHPQS